MLRVIRRVGFVLAALVPMGCATDGTGGPSPLGDSLDSPAYAAVVPPMTAQPVEAQHTRVRRSEPQSLEGPRSAPTASDLAALHAQADDAYRARRFDEALALYEQLIALQPASAHAWLRVGNVHHQRRDWFKALAAYRRASARTLAGVETEPTVRAKAYYNVALVDLELARQSLRSLQRLGAASEVVGDPTPLAREIERTQQRLEAAFPAAPPVQSSAAPDARANGPARRAAPRAGESPRKVDYIRGEPRP